MKKYGVLSMCILSLLLAVSSFKLPADVRETEEGDKQLESDSDSPIGVDITAINEAADVHLFQGDLMLSKEQKEEETSILQKRNAVRSRKYLWRTKRVPYIFDHSVGKNGMKDNILKAIRAFHENTCIRWEPKADDDEYWVKFTYAKGCWASSLGRVKKGQSMISIGKGCGQLGTVLHEMMHMLGFRHEQVRPDRDEYLKMYWENMSDAGRKQSKKQTVQNTDNLNSPYDTRSLMQYGNKAFSKNGKKTMEVISDPSIRLGNRGTFSTLDLQQLNALYDCSSSVGGWSSWSDFGPCNKVGEKKRQRFCTNTLKDSCGPGADSLGVQTETADCGDIITGDKFWSKTSPIPRPIDGHWGLWSPWAECSVKCGQGTKLRTRKCEDPPPLNGGKDCIGASKSTSKCLLKPCGGCADDCDFESGFCGWTNDPTSTAPAWARGKGATLTAGTGPPELSEDGYYVFFDASDSPDGKITQSPGDVSRMISTEFPATTGRCMFFRYSMYGKTMGALKIYVKVDCDSTEGKMIWSKEGCQGAAWAQGSVTIDSSKKFKIVLEAVRGDGPEGDIAVDEITFSDGVCSK